MLIDLYLQGRLALDAFVSERSARRRRGAFDKMHAATCCARWWCRGAVSARIDHTVTSGTFSLDGETFDVDNNVWVLGDDTECLVIDAPHDVAAIVADRRTPTSRRSSAPHAHDDHVRVAPASWAGTHRRAGAAAPPTTCPCGS
jgi:hypothetical protein